MKLTPRDLHRDIAYFYLGLIFAFSISGIALNHRESWSPMNYVYQETPVTVTLPTNTADINDEFIAKLSQEWQLQKQFKGFRIREKTLRINYKDDMVEIDLATGKGTRETLKKRPILGQMTFLHVNTNEYWIWYSDIFGFAMITIAITGTLITKGANSFAQRGWKLTLLGLLIPLIFLFIMA
jgi:hypothetical protein